MVSKSLSMEINRSDTDRNEAAEGGNELALLSGIGDRELWYAESNAKTEEKDGGDGGPMWRFPLWIDWATDSKTGVEYAKVYPALCFHYKASLILKAFFEAHDRLGHGRWWLVRKVVVLSALKKAPGITKEKYYRWDGKEDRAIAYTERLTPGNHEPEYCKSGGADRALITQIAEACGLQNSVVKIVLEGLNKVAADYMVRQRGALDLGFVKLIAVPFRANWKEIVTFKLRKLGLLQYLKEETESRESGTESNDNPSGLPETLCSPHNVALRREKRKTNQGPLPVSRIDYSVEVLTSKGFEREVTNLVTQQRQAGHTAQVGHYEKTVEKLYDQILEILRAYRKKIGYPFARICDSSRSGGLRFVETRGHLARAHGHNLRRIPVHIVPPARGFSALAESSQQELVCAPPTEVPKLPAFSQEEGAQWPEITDVRQSAFRRTLEELIYREGGAGGLPLPNAPEGTTAGEPMLSRTTTGREPSWVDIIGD